jgi:hypothetical protein
MKKKTAEKVVEPVKDSDAFHAVPNLWRPVLTSMVSALVRKDYAFSRCGVAVKVPSKGDSKFIREYIEDYGETLVDIPESVWQKAECGWYDTHWEIMVDLWTAESGESDMVLLVHVKELKEGGYRFLPRSVYVP